MTPAIAAWLRRAALDDRLVLRGSVVLRALSPRARWPADVDHVVPGAITLDALADRVRELVEPTELAVTSVEVLWPDSVAPGIRVMLSHPTGPLQVDLATGEPMSLPPAPLAIAGGEPMPCARGEDLFAWKCHGLVEFGLGQWRAKDLFDLDLLATEVPLEPAALRRAVALAFETHSTSPAILDDFLDRSTWGESSSGRRRWRVFARTTPVDDFTTVRERVRAAVRAAVR